ncbi:hypothetical protein GOP47_0020001 [Adiantum capillus-veneris]|uniref:AAA+ ATPase domain-containing protein n=1 Tax=Adiantum capillus-veneris TaxID=13818 RepID=A0A9D4ZA66_ADICA|nr:hypothetical protein GOP47_0020001 [Adiantum capillus-veneris]
MEREGLVSIGQKLILYAVGSALAYIVVSVGLYYLDSDRPKASERKKQIAKRYGRPLFQTNMYEDMIAQDVVNPDDISITFDSIGGLENVKQSLQELIILPLKRPDLFTHGKLLGLHKGVLLYGPPGTGKTLLAKAIAKESGAIFINVKVANLLSKWLGDNEKLVTALFSLACKLQPSIIFLDEVDSFLGRRKSSEHEALTSIKTEFMSLWDGFLTDQRARVMVLAATNRPWDLDEAVLRRLPRAFEVGLPDIQQRASILRVILKDENVEPDLDYELLASMCEGYSGSDLTDLCKQAAYLPVKDLLAKEKSGRLTSQPPRALRQADFESVLVNSTRSKVAAREYNETRLHGETGAAEESDLNMSDFLKLIGLFASSNIQNDTEV